MKTSLGALACAVAVLLSSCDGIGFRNGHVPGEVEIIDNGRVFHLADGVLVEERKDGRKVHYLIESTVADYELTEEGLDIEMRGEKAGTYRTTPAPEGYVAAWITQVPGEGPEATRFQIEEATLAKFLEEITAATTIRELYDLKQ